MDVRSQLEDYNLITTSLSSRVSQSVLMALQTKHWILCTFLS